MIFTWIKRCLLAILGGIVMRGSVGTFASDFNADFAVPLIKKGGYGDEKAYDFGIDQKGKIIDNIKKLFYPSEGGVDGGAIRSFLRVIAVALFFALLVYTGFQFIYNADNPEGISKAKMSLLYILLGAIIFFLSLWILTKLLNVGGIEGIVEGENSLANKANGIFLFILAALKALAFFLAIIFIAWYGFEMVTAVGEDAKIEKARQGVINVLLALVFIKIIDFIYYIVLSGSFKNKAIEFIAQASKFMTYLIGAALVIALIYAGYTMLLSTGDEERKTKAVNILKSVFIVSILVLLFMLVIHQVFKDVYS